MTRTLLQLLVSALIFHLVLIQPNHPDAMTWQALWLFPLELPVILLGLIALPAGRWGQILRIALVAVLMVIAGLKSADYAMYTALGRGFNPVADLALIGAGLNVTIGAIGLVLTVAAIISVVLATAVIAWALWWASGVWWQLARPAFLGWATAAASLLFAGVAAAEIGQAMGRWSLPVEPPGAAFTARVGVERLTMAQKTWRDLRAFKAAADNDPYIAREGVLSAIDRDVLVVFVESYGRASMDNPLYSETHQATLRSGEARLDALGFAMRSGFVRAPTRGGQSWLSHATFANGLWVRNQISYGAVLASDRHTLFHHAADAGFHTAAVMPQITLEWPEASRMGFETVLAAKDLGYAGLPFNWVTMPDQFTFSALDRLLRHGGDDRRLFVQLALGSSHAPWVPVPELVPWDEIGDGTIFNEMAQSGDTPKVVWRDRDRIREQYRLAIDYSLRVVLEYAARQSEDPPLIFIVGDHQAAGFVAQDDRYDVPVHVIGPERLIDRVEPWGWHEGLIPDSRAEVRSMAEMRDLILDAYTTLHEPGGAS